MKTKNQPWLNGYEVIGIPSTRKIKLYGWRFDVSWIWIILSMKGDVSIDSRDVCGDFVDLQSPQIRPGL